MRAVKMNEKNKGNGGNTPLIICTTVLVETSPQAMPLGAACVASALKAHPPLSRFSVELTDFSREDADLRGLPDEAAARLVAERLAARNPACVCFSVYVWNHALLEMAAEELGRLAPNAVRIAGGPEVTASPLAFRSFDFTVAGQGEVAVPELCAALLPSGGTPRNLSADPIPGVFDIRDGGGNARTGVRAVPCRPEDTPSPYLDGTLDPAKYGGALWELARGCPFKCSYCYESKGEPKISYFPMERLEAEIELFARKKIAQVFVLDPTYNASRDRALKMLQIIEKKAPGMFFYFEARAEFIDRSLARAFARIPCSLQIGLQSADPDVLRNVHRTLDRRKFARNVGLLNDEGVTFGFDLIFGLPGDTLAGFRASIDFALSLYPNNLELFCLSVLPGTRLHDDAAAFGMEWDERPPYHVVRTPTFPPEDIAEAARLARAANVFYNEGRAVPWLNSVLRAIRERPSKFLGDFAGFLDARGAGTEFGAAEIEGMQAEFVSRKLRASRLERLVPIAGDLIAMHGALGRCTADGTESTLTTSYHPDDVMSGYASDLAFFAKNAGRQRCRVRVFGGRNGADWKVL